MSAFVIDNKRIAKNTMMLYARQVITLIVSLYTVRVVLNVLGVEDYGIYNVIGGIVMLFSFLSGTMASATQRFFSFAIGQNNEDRINKTFTVNWIIYGSIAVFAFFLLETVGLWFVKEKLQVPADRFEAVLLLYHFSVLSFIATILTTPFMAIIIAHEDMQIYAYVSILEALMKLGIVFLLSIVPWDKLELYGVLIFIVTFLKALIYVLISSWKYKECQYRIFYWDKDLFFEILNFTGWTLFGQISTVGRNQAVTILLNQVFSPVIVAARAIANNISNQINIFSSNFNIGLYPSIIKSYAADDKRNMFLLVFNGSKITFFLMWIFALPLFLEMETILHLWLKTPPIEAVLFSRLALVEVLINSISLPLTTAARAPGKMKTYEFTLGFIQILIFVASWWVLKLGAEAYSVYIIAIIANLVMFLVRLFIVKALIALALRPYLLKVVLPVSRVIIVSLLPSYALHSLLPQGVVYAGISILVSMVFASGSMYFIGLDKQWRTKIRIIIKTRIQKIIRNI